MLDFLEWLEGGCMKSLKYNLKEEDFVKLGCSEEYDIPSFFFRNLKSDIMNVLKKYSSFDERNFSIKVKVLKGNKYVFLIDCLAQSILIDNNI